MVRTQVQLPKDEYEELRAVAARARRSIADCIREGVRLFLRAKRLETSRVKQVAGMFRPLSRAEQRKQELKQHDRWFADAILAAKRREGSR